MKENSYLETIRLSDPYHQASERKAQQYYESCQLRHLPDHILKMTQTVKKYTIIQQQQDEFIHKKTQIQKDT